MLFKAFIGHYETLGDGFLTTFSHPFLLEEGRLTDLEGGPAHAARQVHYLQQDEPKALVIGRKAGAELRVHDRNVSGRHAQLFPPRAPGGSWEVADMDSSNGTFHNGEQLPPHERRPLRDEDVLGFGPMLTFVFLHPTTFLEILRKQAGAKKRDDAARIEGKPLSASRTMVSDSVGVSAPYQPDGDDPEAGLFLFCEALDPIPLEPGKRLVIGRSAAHADVVLPHPQVSRKHAELECREDGVYVRDLHSANGVFLGGTRLSQNAVQLPPGHVLGIGDFRLSLKGSLPEIKHDTFVLGTSTRRKLVRGNLDKMPLDQILVGVEEKQKSGCIAVGSPEVTGSISFRAGKPWIAETSTGLSGVEAVRRLLQVKAGTFAIDPNHRDSLERQIQQEFGELVLEAFFDG